MSQNITSDFNISNIAPENNPFISPSKSMTKKDKIKALYLDTDDNITAYKTKKKELPSHNQ